MKIIACARSSAVLTSLSDGITTVSKLYDTKTIHFAPTLCFEVPFDGTYGTFTRASTDINDVTCKYCVYYYFHPEARILEQHYRAEHAIEN